MLIKRLPPIPYLENGPQDVRVMLCDGAPAKHDRLIEPAGRNGDEREY